MPRRPVCLLTSRFLGGNSAMQDYFYTLADSITALLQGDEVYTCTFRGEDSDFVRFNRSAIRQPGTVVQRFLAIDLIRGQRHAGRRGARGRPGGGPRPSRAGHGGTAGA